MKQLFICPTQRPGRQPGLFELGRLFITPGAHDSVPMGELLQALERHHTGDFGDVCPEDLASNERAIDVSGRIVSVYDSSDDIRFWIITECDRSATTILLPIEY